MGKVTIYHNPRCSKSRQTLELLQRQGIDPEIVLYLATPPKPATIKSLLEKLDLPVRDIIRSSEAVYQQLDLSDPTITDDALIAAISANPILIQRPIVVHNSRAAIGRPPEAVMEIL